jgi:hypothetical protein
MEKWLTNLAYRTMHDVFHVS